MIIVCDSGSTKADWLIADGKTVSGPFHTVGFNPYFHTSDFVFETLKKEKSLAPFAAEIKEVHFFGAGCSSAERKEIIATGLKQFFTNAKVIVDHDLLACAYASCGDKPGISCIIGTGSNSCWFDGKKVHEKNYGLGFILGDEGSGSYFGKKLLTHYLYGMMPEKISQNFKSAYNLTRDEIITRVYKQPDANVWLASFSRFLSDNRSDTYIQNLLHQGMKDFFELYVCQYEDYENKEVHFVGSIAFIFQDELKAVAEKMNIKVGTIIKQPIDNLMNYFLEKK